MTDLPPPAAGGRDAAEHAGRLIVDLQALVSNYSSLARTASGAETAAVVKADAYGTGAAEIVPALAAAGCRTFFVALLSEARIVRDAAPEATVYVLGGLPAGSAGRFADAGCRPVLGSPQEIEEWAQLARGRGWKLPAAVHVDTGMNRLGLSADDCAALAGSSLFNAFDCALVMTHPACADDLEDPMTDRQKARFDEARARLPDAPASFANSAATLRDPAFHYDLVRPGIALYGGRAVAADDNPMRSVVRVVARVVQLRDARAGETVGYGAMQRLVRDTKLAILSAGYADGYIRLAGAADGQPGGIAFVGDAPAPIVGRISMDLIAVDVTDHDAASVAPGREIELIGPHFTVDDVAALSGTIGYEVLTGLGRRFVREYLPAGG